MKLQAVVIERLRLALGVGYYALTHTAAKDSAGDSIGESRTLKSLGAEGTVGFEFFQSPGGFSASVDFRTQLAFPDQKLVATTFGLVLTTRAAAAERVVQVQEAHS